MTENQSKNTIHVNHDEIELPQSIIESFARFLVPELRKFYDSEEEQREFEQWQKQQEDKS